MDDTADAPIIVGADGSRSGLTAVEAAARAAATFGRALHIIHAFNWLPTAPGDALPCMCAHADAAIDEAVDVATRAAPGIAVTVRRVEGSATTNLLRAARNAALLVVRGGEHDARICLSAECGVLQLAARAPCSVLITRDEPATGEPIVVGVDRSAAADTVLDFAFSAAAATGKPLVVVHVVETSTPPSLRIDDLTELVDRVERRRWAYAVAARVRARWGEPAQVLREESAQAGLLVLGPRGERLGRGLLGPVAQSLVHHGTAPLVIVRGAPVDRRIPRARTARAVAIAQSPGRIPPQGSADHPVGPGRAPQ
ncbi:MAG TPA: universal stress protein [Actinoplanes sp.]|nr:universal stress protein [Actinoplanes sp.]